MAVKYTAEQLSVMATEALVAKDKDDIRWMMLVLQLSTLTRLSPVDVENRIKELAV